MSQTAKWYVIHTYSGYENKVVQNIEKVVENRKLHDLIQEISVPTERVTEIVDGKQKEVERKVFPGYVLVKMIYTDDSWAVVRNTRGVTGFVGPGSKPVPLSPGEMAKLGFGKKEETEVREQKVLVDFAEGDTVSVIGGPWKDTVGKIIAINEKKRTVSMMVEMFGRETKVELDFAEVKKVT